MTCGFSTINNFQEADSWSWASIASELLLFCPTIARRSSFSDGDVRRHSIQQLFRNAVNENVTSLFGWHQYCGFLCLPSTCHDVLAIVCFCEPVRIDVIMAIGKNWGTLYR